MSRKLPYNPAAEGPQVHDRRAKTVSRGSKGHIAEAEVDDPYEVGAKIATLRSVRDDPLGDHLARGHIDAAQFAAGREFQKYFEIAERGPRAMQLSEAVDNSPTYENLTDAQLMAGKWLTQCYSALGKDGAQLVHEMLVSNRTTRQIATARGMIGHDWERYFAGRLWMCLDTLAIVFGYATGPIP